MEGGCTWEPCFLASKCNLAVNTYNLLGMRARFIYTDLSKNHIVWPKNNLRHSTDTLSTYIFVLTSMVLIILVISYSKALDWFWPHMPNFEWQARNLGLNVHLQLTFVSPFGIPGWAHGGIVSIIQPPIWKSIANVDAVLLSITRRKPIFCILLSSTDSLFLSPTVQTFLTE